MELIAQILRDEREADAAQRPTDLAPTTPVPAAVLPPARIKIQPGGASKRWLDDAIGIYLEHLARKGAHSENTLTYTHAPSLRLFRELISDKRRHFGPVGVGGSWDIQLGQITPQTGWMTSSPAFGVGAGANVLSFGRFESADGFAAAFA